MMFGSGEEMRILIPPASPDTAATSGGGGGGGGGGRGKEERVPQWGQQETREFIGIRGELERDFTVSKRNKSLWEVVAARMGERGYRRSPDQCKCKWKNLVNRYKGQETSDLDNGRHCPFFDELHAVFTERARNMQQLLLESETGAPSPSKKKLKRSGGDNKSSDELSDDDDGEDDDSIDEQQSTRTRKKTDKVQQRVADKSKAANISLHELLQDFFQQQQRSEARWQEIMERRALEQRMVEQEWRQSMEKLERERLMLEQAWQEREENRRIREESRAAKRDAVLTTLLNKLIQGDL